MRFNRLIPPMRIFQDGLILCLLYLVKSIIFLGECVSEACAWIWWVLFAHLKAIWYILQELSSLFLIFGSSIFEKITNNIRSIWMFTLRIRTWIVYRRISAGRVLLGIICAITKASQATTFILHQSLQRMYLWCKHIVRQMFDWSGAFMISTRRVVKSYIPADTLRPVSQQKRWIHIGLWSLVGCIIVLSAIGVYGFYLLVQSLPDPRQIGKSNYELTSHIYDRQGESLYEFYKTANRTPIPLDTLPSHVYHATIAIEDKDFFSHKGISPIGGVLRAAKDWYLKGQMQGGSTLTQQLVKMSLLNSERTFLRKIKEALLAIETEKIFSKRDILELYLNHVPYGGVAYGIEEASKTFFHKHASELTIAEAALLAGLPQSPTEYSPFVNAPYAIARRDQVLQVMKEQGYITESEYVSALNDRPNFEPPVATIRAPHFVFYAKDKLAESYADVEVEKAGLHIHSTLDSEIQQHAQTILREELEKVRYINITNGGVLVTKPQTGEILAMVGSVGYFEPGGTGAYNVTTALRQPGSTLKPLLYAKYLQNGATAATLIDDVPTTYILSRADVYRPVNYDGRFHGKVTVRTSLANSYNIPAVKAIDKVGVVPFIDFLRDAGVDTLTEYSRYGLSLSLGGGEVTMVDMAEAYSVLANNGVRVDLTPFHRVLTVQGKEIVIPELSKTSVLNPDVAYIISDILSDNVARQQAFGPRSYLEIPGYKVAVKTGTTNNKRDNWTIGYTPEYLVVVWVGNNDGTPMNQYLASGVTGAAPIWNRVMKYLITEKSNGISSWYARPQNVITKTCLGRQELFVKGTENSVPCIIVTPKPPIVRNGDAVPTPN